MGQFGRAASTLALGILVAASAQSAIIYQVTVTTSAPLDGTGGIVDMQFNPGGASQAATADITAFSGGILGAVEPPLPGNGVVTGDLSTTLGFTNTAALNDFAQNILFGPFFQFIISLDGPALNAPNNGLSGTRFSLLLYETGFANPLVTPDGVILTIDINPDGTITTEGFPAGNAIVSLVDISNAPEPATWSLCAAAMAAAFALRRTRRN